MSFLQHFENLEDPRTHINKKHELLDILFLTVAAVLSGAEGWKGIKEFGDIKLEWLRKFRPFTHGIPVDDTIARVMGALEPEPFIRCFISWVNEIRGDKGNDQIAIDGKTLRRSFEGDRKSALHMITAWSKEHGLVLTQSRSAGKKNENQSVLEMLELLEIKGSLISVDAMNTQKKIATKIKAKGADYILCVKANHKTLLNEIEAYFHKMKRDEPQLIRDVTMEEHDHGHGRIEVRRYTQLPITQWISEASHWKGAITIVEVERERHIKDKLQTETQYYISSLQPDVAAVADAIRSHWEVENKVHWVLDVTYREDDSRIRREHAAENMASLRRFVMNLARIHPRKNSMKGKLQQAGWDDSFREELLFG